MSKKNYILFLLTIFLVCQTQTFDVHATVKCSKLFKKATGEQLINSCNSCRIVKVQRKRPGANAPINRTYTVPPNTTTDLSFRGPGRSRVLSDTSCHPNSRKIKKNENYSPKKIDKRCIFMQRTKKAGNTGIALANACDECRIAVVERIDASGSRRSQNVVVNGKLVITLPPKGATKAGILSEKACR